MQQQQMQQQRDAYARLPTTQKRVRHLTEIVGRNFSRVAAASGSGGMAEMPNVYMVLQEPADDGMRRAPFYCSETLQRTLNPSWAPFSAAAFKGEVNHSQAMLIVQVWRTYNAPNCPDTLLMEWDVDLRALVFVGAELENARIPLLRNSLFFRLGGFWFGADPTPAQSAAAAASTAEQAKDDISSKLLRVDKSRVALSYSETTLQSSLEQMGAIARVRAEQRQLRAELAARMEMSTKPVQLLQTRSSDLERLNNLRAEAKRMRSVLLKEQYDHDQRRENMWRRHADLETAQGIVEAQRTKLHAVLPEIQQNRDILRQAGGMLSERRSGLLKNLLEIFPIKQIKPMPPLYSICEINLPNSEYTGADEEQIATALGWTCQLVQMIASYCDVPLIFAMTNLGSRSTVRDDVFHNTDFPLYSRGVDRFRFDYGVFLLNKNIEQLVIARGFAVQDLRHTLPNIYNLLMNEIERRPRRGTSTIERDIPSPAALDGPLTPSPAKAHGRSNSTSSAHQLAVHAPQALAAQLAVI